MRARTVALLVALLLPITAACGDTEGGTPDETPAPTDTPTKTAAETSQLPNLTGKGLQAAQDAAQAAGFAILTSHDSLGRGRNQIADRNWKVCFQTPAPGKHPTETEVDLGAVKVEEECPAEDDSGKPKKAGDKMPDFSGESAQAARDALPSNASLTVEDVSGQDRAVFLESNWKVCTQEPSAGTALKDQPVTLGVVKFEESCP